MRKKKASNHGKKKRSTGGGRPRVRAGNEVQVCVEFPLAEYAQLAGYTAYLKEKAAFEGDSVWEKSKRNLMLELWQDFWKTLPYETKRLVEYNPAYTKALDRKR